MKIAIRQRGSPAPEVHHLRPLIDVVVAVAERCVDWMLVASDDATSGSVIAKQERISPASSGSSHCRFCSGVP